MTVDNRTMAGIEIRTVLNRRYPDWDLDKSTDNLTGVILVMDAVLDLAAGDKTSAEAWAAVHRVAALRRALS